MQEVFKIPIDKLKITLEVLTLYFCKHEILSIYIKGMQHVKLNQINSSTCKILCILHIEEKCVFLN